MTYSAYVTIINKTFWIVRQKLLNAHSITYVAMVFTVNVIIIFALGAIRVGWWHLFCPKHLIILSAHVAFVTMALIFDVLEIDRWTYKQT